MKKYLKKTIFPIKYKTLLNLYLAQSIPMTFFATVLPVIMRENGFSLTSIGLLQLIKLPWLLKFLWAPLVDTSNSNINKYKKWIFSSELFYAIIIISVAFLNIQTDFKLIVILLLLAFTASATQDIATDAFSYLVLKKEERSIGSSIQTIGNFLGAVIGSGLLLIIYYYFGWKLLIISLAGFVLIALFPLILFKPNNKQSNKQIPKISFKDIYKFFTQRRISFRVLLLILLFWGIIGILSMLKPWMVDLGYNIKQIGIYSGIYGPLSGVIFAYLTGKMMQNASKLIVLKLILSLSIGVALYFYFISKTTPEYWILQIGILAVWGIYSMLTVFVYSFLMEQIRQGREGTDFTLQIVLAHIGSLVIAVASGKFTHQFGYSGLFLLESIISIILLIILPYLYKKSIRYEI